MRSRNRQSAVGRFLFEAAAAIIVAVMLTAAFTLIIGVTGLASLILDP